MEPSQHSQQMDLEMAGMSMASRGQQDGCTVSGQQVHATIIPVQTSTDEQPCEGIPISEDEVVEGNVSEVVVGNVSEEQTNTVLSRTTQETNNRRKIYIGVCCCKSIAIFVFLIVGISRLKTENDPSYYRYPRPSDFWSPSPSPVLYNGPRAVNNCSLPIAMDCDVEGLLFFKASLKQKDMLESWTGDYPCNWTYVSCSLVDGKEYRVTKVKINDDADSRTLVGTLSPSLSKLRYLKVFEVNNQDLSGTVPSLYSLWTNLTQLHLRNNSLWGRIPQQFSEWKQLKKIAMNENQFRSLLPKEYSQCRKIREFNVGDNNFTNTLPQQYSTMSALAHPSTVQLVLFHSSIQQ
eukprot:TRINITY_DN7552_c0_g1_i7.p2 TRINITY_DN7552_c0_g1~~TRINITY_DN7552_c0_g1_i7.p2  ORF type:complete len:349 (+),score=29.59 TRINITY_DN7552_c0_g1_i7:142-1188(+)